MNFEGEIQKSQTEPKYNNAIKPRGLSKEARANKGNMSGGLVRTFTLFVFP